MDTFPRVERAVAALLASGKVVAPVDVLVKRDFLSPTDLEGWRFKRVPAQTSANLIDVVLPEKPLRQWVLTLPYPLRHLLAYNGKALAAVVRIFSNTVLGFYRKQLEARGIKQVQSGTISVIQRVSSDLRLGPHVHMLAFDGGFVTGDAPTFLALDHLSTTDVADVLEVTRIRIVRHLLRRGLITVDDESLTVSDELYCPSGHPLAVRHTSCRARVVSAGVYMPSNKRCSRDESASQGGRSRLVSHLRTRQGQFLRPFRHPKPSRGRPIADRTPTLKWRLNRVRPLAQAFGLADASQLPPPPAEDDITTMSPDPMNRGTYGFQKAIGTGRSYLNALENAGHLHLNGGSRYGKMLLQMNFTPVMTYRAPEYKFVYSRGAAPSAP